MRVIKVQGKGHVSVQPDLVTLAFTVESKAMDYGECISLLHARTENLRVSMTKSGLDRVSLKTSAFNVSTDSYYDEGKRHFSGYKASHKMNIELPADKTLISKVLYHVAQGHSGTDIELNFSVKDKDALRKKVLEQAVLAAKANAETLAAAAGISLGKLVQMDYGWTEVRFYETDAGVNCCQEVEEPDYDIEPEDVKAEDNVTLVYEIVD